MHVYNKSFAIQGLIVELVLKNVSSNELHHFIIIDSAAAKASVMFKLGTNSSTMLKKVFFVCQTQLLPVFQQILQLFSLKSLLTRSSFLLS